MFRVFLSVLIAALIIVFFQPVLSPMHFGLWATLGAILIPFMIGNDEDTTLVRVGLGGAVSVVFLIIAFATSSGMFRASAYEQQLGKDIPSDFTSVLPPIDINQSPLVSEDMAHRSAEKQLADQPALGSQVNLGRFQKQLINGKLYWISFLQHRGFTKWNNTKTTPGYVKVSAVDATDVSLVTEVNGEPLAMRYLPSGYFGDSLDNHLYYNGYAGRAIAGGAPEVDETGRPYYVVTFYRNSIGWFGGSEAASVAIVDVQTGEIKDYALKDAPAWADILEVPSLIKDQVENRGEYVHGWFNPSDQDRLRVSGNPDLVYGADHRAYWYVGLTSYGNDNGLVGFYLIDSRTKAAHRFTLSGATEETAAKAAEGVIPEKHYSATNPLPFIVGGRPTYVFALRDDSGIARAYAMVSIQTFQTLAVSDTLQSALRQYEVALSRDPSSANVATAIKPERRTSKIARIGAVIRQGSTSYTLTLVDLPGRILVAGADLSDALPLAREGDTVTVVYEASPTAGHVLNLTGFSDADALPELPAPRVSPSVSLLPAVTPM